MLKVFIFINYLCLAAAVFVGSAVYAQTNPFEAGTGRQRLSEQEKETLLSYAENSRNFLVQAQRDADGLQSSQKLEIYVDVIKKVILESYKDKNREELILRIALNQALELTVGVPNQDGSMDPDRVLLSLPRNADLIVSILEDSIKIALNYYHDDRAVIASQDFANLPLMKFANLRAKYLMGWNSSILDMPTSHRFLKTGLQQWLNTALNVNNLLKVTYAEEITGTESLLNSLEAAPIEQYPELLMKQVRILRLKTSQLVRDTSYKDK